MKKLFLGTAAAMLAAAVAPAAQAAPNLVVNGGFDSTYVTAGGTANASTPSELGLNGYQLTGWTNVVPNGYNFVFNPTLMGAAAYSSLQAGHSASDPLQLYTSHNGGLASGPGAAPASLISPTGGNFLASDPQYQPGAISQVINGLVQGQQYTLSFYWAAGEQTLASGAANAGPTTEYWTGSLGGSTFQTSQDSTPAMGFSGWQQFTTTITATSTSETLSFLAKGGPSGSQPPFALLDGVTLAAVPEAGTWAMMLAGFGLMGFALRRRVTGVRVANA